MGAKAIASGSHDVVNAVGYEDGEQIPFELALKIAAASSPQAKTCRLAWTLRRVTDPPRPRSVRPVAEHVEHLEAIRAAAPEVGVPMFINTRSDLFKNAPAKDYTDELLAQAIERANAYAKASIARISYGPVPYLQMIEWLTGNAKSALAKED